MQRGGLRNLSKSSGGFRSKFEHEVAQDLKKRKIKFKYEPFKLYYKSYVRRAECEECGSEDVFVLRPYTPDFVLDNGVIIEAKGKLTPETRTKMEEIISSNPRSDIRMLFQRDNWLTRAKKNKYSDWCGWKNIPYAVGQVPKKWAK